MNQNIDGSSPKVRFTYQDNSNYFQSQARPSPHQLSSSYTTSYVQRAISLPRQTNLSKYLPQESNHIKILENFSQIRRSRKHKNFEQSLLNNRQTKRQSKVGSKIENAQYKTNSSQKIIEKAIKTITVKNLEGQNSNEKVSSSKQDLLKIKQLDVQEINRYIDRRLVQKLSELDKIKGDKSMRESMSNEQMRKKQQQIIYLRMEVQRLRRCQKINKQNQNLYLRLVTKLKETNRSKEESLISTSKKQKQRGISHRFINQTPINEFQDLKIIQNEYQSRIQENVIINKKNNQITKQFFNKQPSINIILQQQRDYQKIGRQSQVSKAVTFNNSKQTATVKSHSKRLNLDMQQSIIEMHQKIMFKQTHNKTLRNVPITNRLEQINCQLERKVSRRSASKQIKQRGFLETISNFSRQNNKYQISFY